MKRRMTRIMLILGTVLFFFVLLIPCSPINYMKTANAEDYKIDEAGVKWYKWGKSTLWRYDEKRYADARRKIVRIWVKMWEKGNSYTSPLFEVDCEKDLTRTVKVNEYKNGELVESQIIDGEWEKIERSHYSFGALLFDMGCRH